MKEMLVFNNTLQNKDSQEVKKFLDQEVPVVYYGTKDSKFEPDPFSRMKRMITVLGYTQHLTRRWLYSGQWLCILREQKGLLTNTRLRTLAP